MRTTTPATSEQQYKRELALNIYRLLASNAANARPVYDMTGKSLPKGGTRELTQKRPVNAVRAEIGGTTLTVEITDQRHGEQNDPDALRYACYDLADFRAWFATLLQSNGLALQPPATTRFHEFAFFMASNKPTIRPDLRPAPMFHRKKKGRR